VLTLTNPAPLAGRLPARTLMVLIVDAAAAGRQTFARALRLAGHDVRTAKDGFDALEILQTETPALILSDLHMPRIDGWTLRWSQSSRRAVGTCRSS
jgi:DNA-binding response OmpR family regulator